MAGAVMAAILLAACGGEVASVASQSEDAAAASASPARIATAAVAMPDIHSAVAARAVLEEGGNAVDAAIAASFVLAVTLPEAGNIGGGGFMTLYMDGETDFLDYRETAPAMASRDMYLDADGNFVSRMAQVGALAAGVPGTVRGLAAAHERYGSLPWKRLVEPAAILARDGFEIPADLAQSMQRKAGFYADDVNFASYYKGAAGEILKQPELAATLQRIADLGPEEFYTGETAEMTAAYMAAIGGLITEEDLAAYEAIWREPIVFDWNDRTIVTPPPPSSGGVALAQLLLMKKELAPAFEGVDHNSAKYVHLVAEMEKRVFADRAEYLGDPDYYEVPTEELIDPEYIAARAAEVDPDAISVTEDVRPGLQESMETTHFSVLDGNGDAVSVTTTLNASFGSGVVVEGAGYLLNNEMDDFSAKPGAPNLYGVIGAEANAIQPGKRMLSSMTPSLVLGDEGVAMVVGTPGGPTIFTSVFQAIVNRFDYGLSVADAVGSGRFHHQLLPKNSILFEDRIGNADAVAAELESMGYVLRRVSGYGDVHAITIRDGVVEAAHDPRNRGASFVFEVATDGGEAAN
ncbi:MAG: gamma-glutamyltransferase [Alphaproteobacteria bacterium]|nr:gamma-glutamyltransferase [Alphaproteobacteria bacterium]